MCSKVFHSTRRVDELGRIVLPIDVRKILDIKEKDSLDIYIDDDKIVLEKHIDKSVILAFEKD